MAIVTELSQVWVWYLYLRSWNKVPESVQSWIASLTPNQTQEYGDIHNRICKTGRGWEYLQDWIEDHGGDRECVVLIEVGYEREIAKCN